MRSALPILVSAVLALSLDALSLRAQQVTEKADAHAEHTLAHGKAPDTIDPTERLGTVSFAVSCAPGTQPFFDRGVALLHDFWYDEARPQFERIIAADPNCAMAHWGLAMSGFHQIWNRPDPAMMEFGQKEMQKAGALPIKTARERAYIGALAAFFQPGPAEYPGRIATYSAAMGKLYAQNPEDVDAGAFYALSLLAAEPSGDTSLAQEHKAMAVLKPLFAKAPDNPGVLHYITHACDNPSMAPEGLAAANHYGEVAISGPHAFHMPGHIYARLGLWQQDIDSQLGSIAASERAESHGETGVMDEPHSFDFLLYAYLQSGQDAKAKAALERSAAPLSTIASMPEMGNMHMDGMVQNYRAKLPIFYSLEMRDWNSVAAMQPASDTPPIVATMIFWARAIAHGHLHDSDAAHADLAAYDNAIAEVRKGPHAYEVAGTYPKIERDEILAWGNFAANKPAEALGSMRSAADLQDKVGQGEVDIPAREMLADMLLDLNKPREALAEYELSLKLSPNRLNGLYNAARAAEAAGDRNKAVQLYTALLRNTGNGKDSTRPELARARAAVAATQVAAQ